jgi:LysM repeat protein
VRSGDSLWTIAQRHGVVVADLRRWNDLSGTLVRAGQELRVSAP